MVQRHAARFVKNDYRQTSSVTAMLKELKWDTLESRRTLFQLKFVHKMFTSQVALNPFDYFERNTHSSLRNSHSKKLTLKFARVNVDKNSFFYSIVPLWNSLPTNVIEQVNSDVFFDLCKTYLSELTLCYNICIDHCVVKCIYMMMMMMMMYCLVFLNITMY